MTKPYDRFDSALGIPPVLLLTGEADVRAIVDLLGDAAAPAALPPVDLDRRPVRNDRAVTPPTHLDPSWA